MSKRKLWGLILIVPPAVIGSYMLFWVMAYTGHEPLIYWPVIATDVLFLMGMAGMALLMGIEL